MHSKTTETDRVSFGRAMAELAIVALASFVFAFGVAYGLSGLLELSGFQPKPASSAGPAAAADDGEE